MECSIQSTSKHHPIYLQRTNTICLRVLQKITQTNKKKNVELIYFPNALYFNYILHYCSFMKKMVYHVTCTFSFFSIPYYFMQASTPFVLNSNLFFNKIYKKNYNLIIQLEWTFHIAFILFHVIQGLRKVLPKHGRQMSHMYSISATFSYILISRITMI